MNTQNEYDIDIMNEYDIDHHCSNSTISVGVVLKCHQKSTFQKSYWEIKKLELIFWSQKFSYAESKYQIYAEYAIKTTAGIRSAKRQGAMCKM